MQTAIIFRGSCGTSPIAATKRNSSRDQRKELMLQVEKIGIMSPEILTLVAQRQPVGRTKEEMKPPQQIDDAYVLWWAWSGAEPFFEIPVAESAETIAIYGFAICRYPDSGSVYRFSCNAEWEVENDSQWPSVEEALQLRSTNFDVSVVQWQRW